jgi:hypothetical protein
VRVVLERDVPAIDTRGSSRDMSKSEAKKLHLDIDGHIHPSDGHHTKVSLYSRLLSHDCKDSTSEVDRHSAKIS